MDNKIKVVITMHSELNQRWLDYFCLDTLNEHFDLEYWDCSDFVLPGFHFDNRIERDYVKKIHSNYEFWQNLRRLPKDTLISNDVHFNKTNYIFHRLLSHYFPKINYINFYANNPDKFEVQDELDASDIQAKLSFLQRAKRVVYKSKFLRYTIKYLTHPSKKDREALFAPITWDMYDFYHISCAIGEKYHINHPDVEMYLKYRNSPDNGRGKYMVYIDQFFPYHPDWRESCPGLDVEKVAVEFYRSMNRFFDRVEQKYQCKVIIAAHPLSNFRGNPYGGREMVINRTAELVSRCSGVLMHSSNALSYAMLFRKPILMLVNKPIEGAETYYNTIVNTSRNYDIPLIDTDKEQEIDIRALEDDSYQRYCETYFGNIDDITPNAELLVKYLTAIWHEMYDN